VSRHFTSYYYVHVSFSSMLVCHLDPAPPCTVIDSNTLGKDMVLVLASVLFVLPTTGGQRAMNLVRSIEVVIKQEINDEFRKYKRFLAELNCCHTTPQKVLMLWFCFAQYSPPK
jgi:hypothetical protein